MLIVQLITGDTVERAYQKLPGTKDGLDVSKAVGTFGYT